MNINDVEEKFGFVFPDKFHEIYETGAMEWLLCSYDEFQKRRDEFINDPKAFMMINADCEPITFENYEERIDWLGELIEMNKEYDNIVIKPEFRLVPFAFTGGGDMYCFVYENGKEDPFVILFYHDDVDYEYYGRDFDEFLYVIMLTAAAFSLDEGEEYKTDAWIVHLNYLNDEYREKIENDNFKTWKEVWDIIDETLAQTGKPEIWTEEKEENK